MTRLTTLAATLAFALACAGPVAAQKEHPEHPEDKDKKEHPEHPEGAVELSKDTLADAIQSFVEWDAGLHGGYLFVRDAVDDETLALTLDKVHRERLASLGGGVYFACADFQATNGNVYDLDVFMTESPGGAFHGLVPTEISVHKKEGAARYGWVEEEGVWKKQAE